MKYNKFNLSQNSGVTLVALIISLIIILILAGITLSLTLGNQGVVDRAEESTTSFLIQAEKQEIHVAFTTLNSERLLNKNVEINAGNLEKQIWLNGNTVTVEEDESNNFVISFTKTGHQYIMTPSGEFTGFNNIPTIDATDDPDNPTPDDPEEPEINIPDLTDIYVTLYTDGTLSFSNNEETVEGKTVSNSYGNTKNSYYENDSDVPWNSKLSSITTVSFENQIVPSSTMRWFANCSNLTQINNIENLNTYRTTTMRSMFYGCSKLTNIDVSHFDTSNVTSMQSMFCNSSSLQSLDLSSFDTSNVTNMRSLFYGCTGLTNINLSSFNTSNVTDMVNMFWNCSKLTYLNLSNFDTSNVTNMSYMFGGYNTSMLFTEIRGLENFNTSNVTNMCAMFQNCTKLKSIDLSSFDTSKVENMSYMFSTTPSLIRIYIGDGWNTDKVTESTSMFYSCSYLTGGNRTKYSSSYKDVSRAKADLPSQAGYLTLVGSNINSRTNNREIEYIESTGTQYFDPLYWADQDTKFDIVMESIDWGDYKNVFGVRTGDNSSGSWVYTNRYAIWLYKNQNYIFHLGKDENKKSDLLNHSYINTKFHLTVENGKLTIQDIKNNYDMEISQFDKVANFRTDYSVYVGALTNGTNDVLNLCKYKLYSLKIYEGDTLVKDFTPVYNTVLNQPGMYDNVNEKFYYGMGSNFFSYPQT